MPQMEWELFFAAGGVSLSALANGHIDLMQVLTSSVIIFQFSICLQSTSMVAHPDGR